MANKYDPNQVPQHIKTNSLQRRAKPLQFFTQFLSDIIKDSTTKESIVLWQTKVSYYPWYAEDALYCIAHVLKQPPPDLASIITKYGWIGFSDNQPISKQEQAITWLQQTQENLQSIWNQRNTLDVDG